MRALIRMGIGGALGLVAAGVIAQPLPAAPQKIGMANPASVNCEKLGGKLVIHDSPRGQYGMCVFKDGRTCEEWALYRDDRCVQVDAQGLPIAERAAAAPHAPK
ncbi:DUF333 domain-containing protein [Burkholderia sp. FERM BP-3421]|jgi:uncharacterized protein|uniref:putative hemolysin n=1 Tax=Burkholderia sp. FERM BP-3421 TaxID=1494466 RepID=UPI0023628EFD|nr:DUF333 domain-containing protein [Burkholderia sp. FERM BP-3421]WDD94761.1 DUF333 domain-containing protein [Burkholderia sp. FERM BP-3421]